MMRPGAHLALAAGWWLLVGVCVASAQNRAPLPAASDGEHAWCALERNGKEGTDFVLLHHAEAMAGPFVRQAFVSRVAPVALAADQARLWVVMAPEAGRPRRDVYALTASRNPATGSFYYEPAGRLELLRSLPADGALQGVVACDGTLYALRAGAPLERLGSDGWEPIAGPAPGSDATTVLPEPAGTRLMKLQDRPALLREGSAPWILARDGGWSTRPLPLPEGALLELIPGAARPAALLARADGALAIAYARAEGSALLTSIPTPTQPWAIVGLGDGFTLLLGTGDGGVAQRRIDGIDGHIGAVEVLQAQPSDPTAWIHLPILGVIVIAAVLAAVLLRSAGAQASILVPQGRVALPMPRRMAALGIDLIPGVVIALLAGGTLAEIAVMPLWTTKLQSAVPGLIAIASALAICTLTELISGASLGKWIVGGEVVTVLPAGARPRIWQVLVRNLFKGIILLAPIAGLFTVAVPGGRGIGEVASRTAVVRRGLQAPDALKGERDERR